MSNPMISNPGSAKLGERAAKRMMQGAQAVVFRDAAARGAAQRAAPARAQQQIRYCASEAPRLIGQENFITVRQLEALGAQRGRDDRLGHRRRLQHLASTATA